MGGGGDFLDEIIDACGVVLNRESGFEDIAVAVADEGEVFALGVVKGDTEDIAGIPGALEDGANVDVLISIDGLCFARCFHGTEKIPF